MIFGRDSNRTCSICGAKLSRGARYCDNCGAKVPDAPPVAATPGRYAPGPSRGIFGSRAAVIIIAMAVAIVLIVTGLIVMSFSSGSEPVPDIPGGPVGSHDVQIPDLQGEDDSDTDDGFWGDFPQFPAGSDPEQFMQGMEMITQKMLSEDMSISTVTVDFDRDEKRLTVTVQTGESTLPDDETFDKNVQSVKDFMQMTMKAYGEGNVSVVIIIKDENGKEIYRMENLM